MIHQPPDALAAPRFTGPRTFARLPHLSSLEGAHAAVFGMPWDGGTSFRSGARFGPEAVRSASGMIRTYNPVQRVQVFGELSTIDYGDANTVPGYIEDTLARMSHAINRLVGDISEPCVGIGISVPGLYNQQSGVAQKRGRKSESLPHPERVTADAAATGTA